MPKFRIYQTLVATGHVDIEADTEEEAYNNSAEEKFTETDESNTFVNYIQKL